MRFLERIRRSALSGFTPAYGSAVRRFAAGFFGTAEAVPLSKAVRA